MEEKKGKLILDGNALYEIDSECLAKKKKTQQEQRRREADMEKISKKEEG